MSFSLLWEITLGSWLTAALILLARLLLGRWLNARAKYALWLLLILRLLPLPLRSPTSLLRFTPEPLRAEAVETFIAPAADRLAELTEGKAEEPPAESGEAGLRERLRRLWFCGAAAVLLAYLVLYVIAAGRLRSLPPCTDPETLREYLRLKQLCHPGFNPRLALGEQGLLGGFLRPVLVIPVELRGEGAVPILLHELMHFKFWDVWLGLLFRLLCALHWFNPAVWFCFWLLRRDGELACDQRVLDTGIIEPRVYAKALMEEYQRCGEPDPAPMAHWGTRAMMRRISGILGYRKPRPRDRILPILLGAVILALGVLSPWKSRSLTGNRSIPFLVDYPDAETYVQALRQTPLGAFGCTWSELMEAGYLTEEGTWTSLGPEKRVYTVRRFLIGEERKVRYIFRPTLYTRGEGKLVLTEISMDYPPYDEDYDRKVKAVGVALTEGWETLNRTFVHYVGHYFTPVRAEQMDGWEFLYWLKRPEDLEEIYGAVTQGKKLTYSIYCTPVTLADCLAPEERETLADLAAERGWAGDRQEGLQIMGGWHLAGVVSHTCAFLGQTDGPSGAWTLNGMGLALYLTRPAAGD